MAQSVSKGQHQSWKPSAVSTSSGGLQTSKPLQPTGYAGARAVAMGTAPKQQIAPRATSVSQPKGYEGAQQVARGQAPVVPMSTNYKAAPAYTVIGTRPNPPPQQAMPAGGGMPAGGMAGGGMPSGGMSMGDLAGMLAQMMGGGAPAATPEPKPEPPKPEPGTGPGWVDPRDPLTMMGGGHPEGDVTHGTGLIQQMLAAAPAMPQRGDPSGAPGPKAPSIPAAKPKTDKPKAPSTGGGGRRGRR